MYSRDCTFAVGSDDTAAESSEDFELCSNCLQDQFAFGFDLSSDHPDSGF